MNGLDLFSGIAGLTVALAPWVQPVAYCEIDPAARAVLLARMADGSIPVAPIWDDVRTLRGGTIPWRVDIIYGGFPCTDVSHAGRRVGLGGARSGLYREIVRLVDECEPAFAFLENVRGVDKYIPRIIADFTERGFVVQCGALAASEVGAPHIRDRVWFLAANPVRVEQRIKQGGQDLGQFALRCTLSPARGRSMRSCATPTAKGNYNRKGASERSADGLATQVGGPLNPAWTEWLMGYPTGWTDSKCSAMQSSPRKRARHSASSQGSVVPRE